MQRSRFISSTKPRRILTKGIGQSWIVRETTSRDIPGGIYCGFQFLQEEQRWRKE